MLGKVYVNDDAVQSRPQIDARSDCSRYKFLHQSREGKLLLVLTYSNSNIQTPFRVSRDTSTFPLLRVHVKLSKATNVV